MNTEQTVEELEQENKRLREELRKAQLEVENQELAEMINKIRLGKKQATYTSPQTYSWEPERDTLGNVKVTCSTISDEEYEKRLEQILQQLFK